MATTTTARMACALVVCVLAVQCAALGRPHVLGEDGLLALELVQLEPANSHATVSSGSSPLPLHTALAATTTADDDGTPQRLTRFYLEGLSKAQLVAICRERGLPYSDTKDGLVNRILVDVAENIARVLPLDTLLAMDVAQLRELAVDREVPHDNDTPAETLAVRLHVQTLAMIKDRDGLKQLTVAQLRDALRANAWPVSGVEDVLIERLLTHYADFEWEPLEERYSIHVLNGKTSAALTDLLKQLEVKSSAPNKKTKVLRVYTCVYGRADNKPRLLRLLKADLQAALADVHLPTSGTKEQLVARIVAHYAPHTVSDFSGPRGDCTLQPRARTGAKAVSEIKLGSWNVRNLSRNKDAAMLDRIAWVIWHTAPDVLALQEVLDHDIIAALVEHLRTQYCVEYVADTSESVGRTLDPATGRMRGKSEQYSFLYTPDIVDSVDTGAFAADGDNDFIREPYCKPLRAGAFDFVFCTVHILFGTRMDDRRAEIGAIDDVYRAELERHAGERDIVFAGDFNMKPTDRAWDELRAHTFSHAIDAPHKTTIGSVSLYDNFWWPEATGEVVAGSGSVFNFDEVMYGVPPPPECTGRCDEEYRQWAIDKKPRVDEAIEVSDHRPIFVTARITGDDDDRDE